MKEAYFDVVVMIERLHRLFLEVVKGELDRKDFFDITNVQALILYNIGKSSQLTVGELTNRGYYLGSNVSYNLRKMVKHGYVSQNASEHDRRSSHVKLTEKGVDLYKKIDEAFSRQTQLFAENHSEAVELLEFGKSLRVLETFWTSLMEQR